MIWYPSDVRLDRIDGDIGIVNDAVSYIRTWTYILRIVLTDRQPHRMATSSPIN